MSKASRAAGWAVRALLRVVWVSVMVLVPLFGFWLASSLAAYQNASQWLALLVGLLLFPLVPLWWDLIFVWRRSRKQGLGDPILTRLDRLVLRTLIINGLFLGGMMWHARGTALRALAVRGDWMFDGREGPIADAVRGWMLALADRLDRHGAEEHYGKSDDAPDPSTVPPAPTPVPPQATPEAPKPPSGWPLSTEVDPAVRDMPADAQDTVEHVGAYLAAHVADPKARVKAIHDYVVLRLDYDEQALKDILAGNWSSVPSQQPADVFARKSGVCEGYARLTAAIGKAAGVEIAYITGYIRDARRRTAPGDDATVKAALEGYSHAWNAAKLDGQWQLIDTTWDDPVGGTHGLRTTYLFTPPQLFGFDHLPEDPAWQLVATPLSPGEFARQPMLSPEIGTLGVTLEQPTRSQISASGHAELLLGNPYHAKLVAEVRVDDGKDAGRGRECDSIERGDKTAISCKLDDGEWEIRLYGTTASAVAAASAAHGSYQLEYIGSILANSR